MQGTFHNKFLLKGFFKCFSGLYSVHDTSPSSVLFWIHWGRLPWARRRGGGGRGGALRPSCAKASGAAASDRNPFWCHWQSRPVQVTSHPVVTLAGHLKRSGNLNRPADSDSEPAAAADSELKYFHKPLKGLHRLRGQALDIGSWSFPVPVKSHWRPALGFARAAVRVQDRAGVPSTGTGRLGPGVATSKAWAPGWWLSTQP